ncbi:hypothetical protein PG996_009956, partial [Apiospora saccharicola]
PSGRESVQFRDLWMLFQPRGLIYTPHSQQNHVRLPRSPNLPFHRILPRLPPGKQSTSSNSTSGNGPPLPPPIKVPPVHEWNEPLTPQAYKIISVVGGMPKLIQHGGLSNKTDACTPLMVLCYYISFTWTEYACICDVFPFAPFDGERGITSLATYPFEYARDYMASEAPEGDHSAPVEATMIDFLSGRGHSFIQVSEASHRLYEGLTVGRDQEEINTPVIIDLQLAHRNGHAHMNPRASLPSSDFFAYDGIEDGSAPEVHLGQNYHAERDWHWTHQLRLIDKARADMVNTLKCYPSISSTTPGAIEEVKHAMEEDGHVFLLPGTVWAFALRLRKWVSLDLSLVKPIVNQADWEDLILPSGHKSMVRAVESHAAGSRSTGAHVKHAADIDIVHGKVNIFKGKGCVILLHGEPGVGKTSTAGDIGYDPEDVQDNLDRLLGLTQIWGCVVLLDEADVFLAKRSRDDVKRNGLVSVFLRILEYYQGILFLSTNRVGSIDDAFRSRLHLTLYYPKLGPKQTLAIWNVKLRRLEDPNRKRLEYGQEPIEVQKGQILRYAKKKWKRLGWNGRQIRNAFQTAVALAEFEANKASSSHHHDGEVEEEGRGIPPAPVRPVMTKKHFKTVAKASVQFDEYLFHTHGGSDLATNTRKEQVRWDYELRDSRKDQHHHHHHHHHQRLGGDHRLSSDSSSSESSSSSDSDSDANSGSSLSADSAISDDGNSGGFSDNSSEDRKKKWKKKTTGSGAGKERGKSKKGSQGKKHKSRK